MTRLILIICFFIFLAAANAQAEAIYPEGRTSYGDETIKWALPDSWNIANYGDVHGNPDLGGVQFDITDDGYLKKITLEYTYTYPNTSSPEYRGQAPGDWFIDLDSNGAWDIVLTTNLLNYRGQASQDAFNAISDTGNWNAYESELIFNEKSSYLMAFGMSGWSWRTNHPALANLEHESISLVNNLQINFSGWKGPINEHSSPATWELLNTGLYLGNIGTFTYGFAMTCANDVLYGVARYDTFDQTPNPVPEPGTALLLGLGMLGLAAAARRRS